METKSYQASIKLNGIGDLLIHSPVYEDAETNGSYDFTPMFEPIEKYLKNADITIANQETILGGTEIGLSTYPSFNSPFELGDALKEVGVDIVSIANNHTLDRGEKAIMNATGHLNDIGLEYVGGYRSEEDRNTHRILNRKGISVGFLSYTYGTNGIPVPEGKDYLVNLIDVDTMLEDLEEIKSETDFVVVSMHFGQQYQPLPNEEQEFLSELLISEGADVILGHHPHVLQPVDWISSEDGDKVVYYSLGNFLSAQEGTERLIGAISQVELTKTIEDGSVKTKVSNAKLMPTYNLHDSETNFRIVPLADITDDQLEGANSWYEDTEELIKTFTDDIDVVPYLE
ncbi:capsular biosynthesis protein [Halalkalibacillus sediminis]|uniref:Capsular biosynthesis protein n=2 Tax=Halalkalibacillus sediminis TaxID=2018042 RepID=A0A2I0QYI9_9BACI|nr:capsular biosynthesis protein [Halalkalibacillus sediminis]